MDIEKDRREANKLLLAYAVGCADSQLIEKKVSDADYNRLVTYAHMKEPPATELDDVLGRCFPTACENIGRIVHLTHLRNHANIPEADSRVLEEAFHHEREPDEALMKKYFDIPAGELRTLRTYAHVAHYWRIVHMYSKETPVRIGTVTAHADEDPMIPVRMTIKGKCELTLMRNTRYLPLKAGTRVYVHGGTVAEIMPQALRVAARK